MNWWNSTGPVDTKLLIHKSLQSPKRQQQKSSRYLVPISQTDKWHLSLTKHKHVPQPRGKMFLKAFSIHSLEKLFHLLPTKSSAFGDLGLKCSAEEIWVGMWGELSGNHAQNFTADSFTNYHIKTLQPSNKILYSLNRDKHKQCKSLSVNLERTIPVINWAKKIHINQNTEVAISVRRSSDSTWRHQVYSQTNSTKQGKLKMGGVSTAGIKG